MIPVLSILLSLPMLLFLAMVLYASLKTSLHKQRYTVRRHRQSVLKRLVRLLGRQRQVKVLLERISIKIGIFTPYSMDKNLEYGVLLLIVGMAAAGGTMIFFLQQDRSFWYLSVFYLFFGCTFLWLMLSLANAVASLHFTGLLPQTYKILNSRYTTEGDMLKAIHLSIPDFSGPMVREMTRIENVLRKNDQEKIDATFLLLEEQYGNEYFTYLLNLIRQAYYKGGNENIKRQLENMTEEILLEIENQKDLAAGSRMYIALMIFLPLGMRLLEGFNERALGENALLYYASVEGAGMKLFLLLTMLLCIGLMIYLEKTGLE